MCRLDMSMQVRPAQARHVAFAIGAIVLQEQPCIFEYIRLFKVYPHVIVRLVELLQVEVFKIFGGVVGEYYVI